MTVAKNGVNSELQVTNGALSDRTHEVQVQAGDVLQLHVLWGTDHTSDMALCFSVEFVH